MLLCHVEGLEILEVVTSLSCDGKDYGEYGSRMLQSACSYVLLKIWKHRGSPLNFDVCRRWVQIMPSAAGSVVKCGSGPAPP